MNSKMKRRQFLQLAGAAGLAPALPGLANAAGVAPTQFFVYYHTSGGWDATSLLDPKGNEDRGDNKGTNSIVNKFTKEQILKRGNISYSPLWINNNFVDDINVGVKDPDGQLNDSQFTLNTLNNALSTNNNTRNSAQQGLYNAFFAKYYQNLRVLNGVNHQTNSHDTGRRNASSGTNSMGHPNLGALYSGAAAPDASMSHITDGQGYAETAGVVSQSRMDEINNLNYLTNPNKIDVDNNYFDTGIMDDIRSANAQSQAMLESKTNLKSIADRLGLIKKAQSGSELQVLIDALSVNGDLNVKGLNNAQKQMSISAAAFSNGIAASCHISSNGGFDTHGDNDNRVSGNMREVLSDLHHLWQQLEAFGVADQTTVLVGSDFGRTPWYNSNNGKDHWNVSSMMLMGNGIRGNSMVQASDRLVNAQKVNPANMQLDDNGVFVTPALVHQGLRYHFGIDNHELSQKFPLDAPLSQILG